MQEVKLSEDMVLMVYGSIKELPIKKSKALSKYLLIDAGIGSTMEDVDNHLARIFTLISQGKTHDAMEEAKNMRMNLFQMLSGLDYRSLSLLALVHSVNGVVWDDDSEAGLNRLKDQLENFPVGKLEEALEQVKKNLIPNAQHIFPPTLETILTT